MPKISELNASIALTGDELILLVQDATTVRTTINTLKTLFTQDIPDRGPIESSLTNPRRLTYSVPKERLFLVKFALDSFFALTR